MGLTRRGRITEKDVDSELPTENRQLSLSLESFGKESIGFRARF